MITDDLLLQRGIAALKNGQPQAALLDFATVWRRYPHDITLPRLLALAAKAQHETTIATALIETYAATLDDGVQSSSVSFHTIQQIINSILTTPRPSRLVLAPDSDPARCPVIILVPIYLGREETMHCLHSLVQSSPLNQTPHRFVVLNDCSPDQVLIHAVEQLCTTTSIILHHHSQHLGFIKGMNRAMACYPQCDVVWLNSDTRVHGNWLDRLRAHAYRDDHIASVTPLSNHGGLMSFPDTGYDYPMPDPMQQQFLDQQAARVNAGQAIPLAVGCGFCLFIRRRALDAVGDLDEHHLRDGYGEDTDWCLRAQAQGWQHVGAVDVFVAHRGTVSFGARKARLVAYNNALLRQRYPEAERQYQQFLRTDPLLPARQALQRARWPLLLTWLQQTWGPEPRLGDQSLHPRHLHIMPAPGLDDPWLATWLQPERSMIMTQGRLPPRQLLWLTWRQSSRGLDIILGAALPTLPLVQYFQIPNERHWYQTALKQLPIQGIVFHGLTPYPNEMLALPEQLRCPYVLIPVDHDLQWTQHQPYTQQAWQRFLSHAQRIMTYSSPANAKQFQGAPLRTSSVQTPGHEQPSPPAIVFIIADPLYDAQLGARWLTCARQLAYHQPAIRLVAIRPGAWLVSLQRTASVLLFPELLNLKPDVIARLIGAQALISLETTPGAGWRVPTLAQQLQLPFYAPTSSQAIRDHARPLAATWVQDGILELST
jgi:GT2 family glycosyltransferase